MNKFDTATWLPSHVFPRALRHSAMCTTSSPFSGWVKCLSFFSAGWAGGVRSKKCECIWYVNKLVPKIFYNPNKRTTLHDRPWPSIINHVYKHAQTHTHTSTYTYTHYKCIHDRFRSKEAYLPVQLKSLINWIECTPLVLVPLSTLVQCIQHHPAD